MTLPLPARALARALTLLVPLGAWALAAFDLGALVAVTAVSVAMGLVRDDWARRVSPSPLRGRRGAP